MHVNTLRDIIMLVKYRKSRFRDDAHGAQHFREQLEHGQRRSSMVFGHRTILITLPLVILLLLAASRLTQQRNNKGPVFERLAEVTAKQRLDSMVPPLHVLTITFALDQTNLLAGQVSVTPKMWERIQPGDSVTVTLRMIDEDAAMEVLAVEGHPTDSVGAPPLSDTSLQP